MSIRQLDSLLPNSPAQSLQLRALKQQKIVIKSLKSYRRAFSRYWKAQYFFSDAMIDVRRGFKANQDISLSVSFLAIVLCFSVITLFSNIVLTFLLDSNYIAKLVGANLVLIVAAAGGVMLCTSLWLLIFLQNNFSISIWQGINKKQKKSLLSTLRDSLRHTSLVSAAWLLVLTITFLPVVILMLITLSALYLLSIHGTLALAYIVGIGVIGITWVIAALTNLSLAPYTLLFDHEVSVRDAITLSCKLVKNKGQWFIGLSYFALLIGLGICYVIAYFVQKLIGINTVLIDLTLSFCLVFIFNACLTMLYRKRRLARS